MNARSCLFRTCFGVVALVAACAPPVLVTPLAEIPKLTTLAAVMDNQATAADPQFKKIGADKFSDDDFAALAAVGERIQATSLKIKDFTKGKEFDDLAMKLNGHAKELSTAAAAKDAAASSKALADMKATCKTCHSLFR